MTVQEESTFSEGERVVVTTNSGKYEHEGEFGVIRGISSDRDDNIEYYIEFSDRDDTEYIEENDLRYYKKSFE